MTVILILGVAFVSFVGGVIEGHHSRVRRHKNACEARKMAELVKPNLEQAPYEYRKLIEERIENDGIPKKDAACPGEVKQ